MCCSDKYLLAYKSRPSSACILSQRSREDFGTLAATKTFIMKLATLTLLLLVAAAANSGPVDTELSDDTLMEVETGSTEETPVNMDEFSNGTMDNTSKHN